MRNPQSNAGYSDKIKFPNNATKDEILFKLLMAINDNLALIADNLEFINSDGDNRLLDITMVLNEIASK